ncbi:hypothetical protein HanRHA438_Chr12g0558101 [Helianthus annuus]|nr:hypothetical protein HanRHA438_Chr12g0558101 [Helianthus annuus]
MPLNLITSHILQHHHKPTINHHNHHQPPPHTNPIRTRRRRRLPSPSLTPIRIRSICNRSDIRDRRRRRCRRRNISSENRFREQHPVYLVNRNRIGRMHTATNFCVGPTRPDLHSPGYICEVQSVGASCECVNRSGVTEVLEIRQRVVMR